METAESSKEANNNESMVISVARGGPIYVPNLVGPLTRVPDFESALLRELQNLKIELSLDSSSFPNDDDDVDLSVDDIKLLTDEDLVEMALTEDVNQDEVHPSEEPSKDASVHVESSERGQDPLPDLELNESNCGSEVVVKKSRKRKKSSDESRVRNRCNGIATRKSGRKTDGRWEITQALHESCLTKVGELLKVKEKQEQDKKAARLHSLMFACKISKSVVPSSEKTESLKYLRSTYYERQHLKPTNIQEHVALRHPEFILSIEVYHNIQHWVKTQEFLVLGRQTLTEFRDKIYCMTDQVMEKAGQHDPSGYFLVEDVFCNDLRHPSAIDYSEPVFDWLTNSRDDALRKWECITGGESRRKQKAVLGQLPTSRLPQFRRFEMQKTRFCDLKFSLGAGYLYCHQGDCKHTIVIRDMRLVHPEDVQNRAAYPVLTFQLKPRFQKCDVCGIFRARKVTVDDKWTPHTTCYFCNDCYFLLHYDNETGSLLYPDFSTYDYVHDLPD